LAQKKVLTDKIQKHGGSVLVGIINAKVKYLVCPADRLSPYLETQAQKFKLLILRENFVDEWAAKNGEVDMEPFVLFDGTIEVEEKHTTFFAFLESEEQALDENSSQENLADKENSSDRMSEEIYQRKKDERKIRNRHGELVVMEKLVEKANIELTEEQIEEEKRKQEKKEKKKLRKKQNRKNRTKKNKKGEKKSRKRSFKTRRARDV